jgi:hypothetical protein
MTGQNFVAEMHFFHSHGGFYFRQSLEDLNVEIGVTLQEDNFSTGNGILNGWITAGPLEEKLQILQMEEYLESTNIKAYSYFPYIIL